MSEWVIPLPSTPVWEVNAVIYKAFENNAWSSGSVHTVIIMVSVADTFYFSLHGTSDSHRRWPATLPPATGPWQSLLLCQESVSLLNHITLIVSSQRGNYHKAFRIQLKLGFLRTVSLMPLIRSAPIPPVVVILHASVSFPDFHLCPPLDCSKLHCGRAWICYACIILHH